MPQATLPTVGRTPTPAKSAGDMFPKGATVFEQSKSMIAPPLSLGKGKRKQVSKLIHVARTHVKFATDENEVDAVEVDHLLVPEGLPGGLEGAAVDMLFGAADSEGEEDEIEGEDAPKNEPEDESEDESEDTSEESSSSSSDESSSAESSPEEEEDATVSNIPEGKSALPPARGFITTVHLQDPSNPKTPQSSGKKNNQRNGTRNEYTQQTPTPSATKIGTATPDASHYDYDSAPLLVGRPVVGSTIAYKTLELSKAYQPIISEFKAARVVSFNAQRRFITLAPEPVATPRALPVDRDDGEDEEGEVRGKFAINSDDELTSDLQADVHAEGPVQLDIDGLMDVRVIGFVLLLHSGYSAFDHLAYLKMVGKVEANLPIDIVVECLASVLFCMVGVVLVAGDLKPISLEKTLQQTSMDTLESRPNFRTLHHRGKALFGPSVQ
ncbi:hypothetical protein HKX48_004283 [Thoreauomyces humboldtii]|nr:hypothetical protein HKX48_004283 [Thoreauomyces humboldtii]